MTSVEHLSHPDRGCAYGPDTTRHPFTRKLQLDCAQESAAGQEPASHITDERSHPPQCIDFELVSAPDRSPTSPCCTWPPGAPVTRAEAGSERAFSLRLAHFSRDLAK